MDDAPLLALVRAIRDADTEDMGVRLLRNFALGVAQGVTLTQDDLDRMPATERAALSAILSRMGKPH